MLSQAERAERMKRLLLSCTQHHGGAPAILEGLHRASGVEFTEGLFQPASMESVDPSRLQARAVAVLEQLDQKPERPFTDEDLYTTEAIIFPKVRPAALIQQARWQALSAPWEHLNADAVRRRFAAVIPSVGRVEVASRPGSYGGTGFVVAPNRLMTNRHVAELFTRGLGNTGLIYHPGDAAVDMLREYQQPPATGGLYCTVRRVVMIHPYWDMAILEVEGLDARLIPLTLSAADMRDVPSREVLAIGYPAFDPDRNSVEDQDYVFKGIYEVKRVQPGVLQGREQVTSFNHPVSAAVHDCSTLGGSSGSAIVDVATGHVLGLHFSGVYKVKNYAVPASELARDGRVVDAGLTFDGPTSTSNEWEAYWRLNSPASVPGGERDVSGDRSAAVTGAVLPGGGGPLSLTVPLTIIVSLGPPGLPGSADGAARVVSGPASVVTEAPKMQVPIIYDGLEHRAGYDPDFLGIKSKKKSVRVELPALTAAGKKIAAPVDGGGFELKYHKFSIVMHRQRRLALFTAANVNWSSEAHQVDGKKPSRKELTGLADGQQERWVTDDRLSPEAQLPDVFYTKDDGAFDKGHLVRRDDVCWGSSFKDIQKSNGDTYHTTNCSPQVLGFNRSAEGTDNWGDLENMVQQETKEERVCLFSGPVLGETDRIFVGRGDTGPLRVRIPQKFWKIICVRGEAGVQSYGFLLEQSLGDVPLTMEELAIPARWRKKMVAIQGIEALLNGWVTLGALKDGDQFAAEESVRLRRRLGQ